MTNVIIIGSGRRVLQTALPAFHAARGQFNLVKIFSRNEKTLRFAGGELTVDKLSSLTSSCISGIDLVYLAVEKYSVAYVLKELDRFDVSNIDLLIETPVIPVTHLGHTNSLRRFKSVSVAEDCVEMPWLETIEKYCRESQIGCLKHVVFFHSAFQYHAIATIRKLFNYPVIRKANSFSLNSQSVIRSFFVSGGRTAQSFEPRDYLSGRWMLVADGGTITDFDFRSDNNEVLRALVRNGRCAGFELGGTHTLLSDDEIELISDGDPEQGVTRRIHDYKKVGFLRILRQIALGKCAYPLDLALDDMTIDHFLNLTGRFQHRAIFDLRTSFGRTMVRASDKILRKSQKIPAVQPGVENR